MNYMSYAGKRGIADLGQKAKKNILSVEIADGGTFTTLNSGVFGSPLFPNSSRPLKFTTARNLRMVDGGPTEERSKDAPF